MPKPETLNSLLEKYPEWKDIPIAIQLSNGMLDYIGCSGGVYLSEDYSVKECPKVIVFTPN